MLDARKQKRAIRAIQDLIIEARNLAYQNISGKDLAEFLDGIEYFPTLIIEEKDNTDSEILHDNGGFVNNITRTNGTDYFHFERNFGS